MGTSLDTGHPTDLPPPGPRPSSGARDGALSPELSLPDVSMFLESLSRAWSVPALLSTVHISISPRMTRTLARAFPRTGEIRLSAPVVQSGSPELIREVLCHEAAHIAAHLKYGRGIRPHGTEWRDLVRLAGFEPRVRLASPAGLAPVPVRRRPLVFQHRCASCGSLFLSRTTNRRWRCASCVRAGRDGRFVVTRLDQPIEPAAAATRTGQAAELPVLTRKKERR